ncbi:Leucine Rich Repeat [Seminavis robusta]|uniref:Leucine Rich Repeat n=1 Tax=Seminavis robusta TaxID=568900 RepID=A0A9N8HYI0_9STRA|nr:Leucine Rich Repeat [Seminavis robusta]|eukprot:Sro2000_g310250.1 Leucine Rich Repeat (794) ;mRNA; r:12162-14718
MKELAKSNSNNGAFVEAEFSLEENTGEKQSMPPSFPPNPRSTATNAAKGSMESETEAEKREHPEMESKHENGTTMCPKRHAALLSTTAQVVPIGAANGEDDCSQEESRSTKKRPLGPQEAVVKTPYAHPFMRQLMRESAPPTGAAGDLETGVFGFVPLPNPLPTSSEDRSNAAKQHQEHVVPGAFAISGHRRGTDSHEESKEEIETSQDFQVELVCNNSGRQGVYSESYSSTLSVAMLVDSEPHLEIPQAKEFDTTASKQREQGIRQFKIKIFAGVSLLILILVILVAILVPQTNATDYVTTAAPREEEVTKGDPTQAPTSFESLMLSLLPEQTISAIHGVSESPQSKAFDWILEDNFHLPYLSDNRKLQRFALATLYFATDGDNWATNTHWLNHSVHECEWHNVSSFALKAEMSGYLPGYLSDFFPSHVPAPTTCHSDGSYQQLWLDNNGLAGSLPLELFWLTSLESLSMAKNRLQGTISSHVGKLESLKLLDLSFQENAGLGGSVPSEIGLLTHMRLLSLEENQHTSFPTELWQLTNLEILWLANNNLEGTIPSVIGAFSNMWVLGIDLCNITGTIPTEIGQMEKLEWLYLDENRLTGSLPSELGRLSRMDMMRFSGNSLEGTLPTELGLVTSTCLLFLQENKFSGQLPSELGMLTSLSVILNLGANEFTGTIPTELGLLNNLDMLTFDNGFLTGPVPSELGLLSSIERLSFANNSLSGSIPPELSSLQQSLHTMILQGNPLLSGRIPDGLCSVNASCSQTHYKNPCQAPFGLFFDCTRMLCGCGCSCVNG